MGGGGSGVLPTTILMAEINSSYYADADGDDFNCQSGDHDPWRTQLWETHPALTQHHPTLRFIKEAKQTTKRFLTHTGTSNQHTGASNQSDSHRLLLSYRHVRESVVNELVLPLAVTAHTAIIDCRTTAKCK